MINQRPEAWFSTCIEDLDIEVLGIQRGESSGQAALESMALLIGLRAWPQFWKEEKTLVLTRSDALAAIGALLKMSSPSVPVNTVMMEIALDCADGLCEVEVVGHIPGRLNVWADALSRLEAPEPDRKEVPEALLSVTRVDPGERGRGWWRTRGGQEADVC